jgi:AraC family transcriptional regulator, transcriptional activator of pobA
VRLKPAETVNQEIEPRRESIPLHELTAGDGLPFEINSLEESARAARAGYPHRHSFYQVLFLTGGRGQHVVDFTSDSLAPPCLYFISPGQVHFWELEEPPAGKVIRFAPDFLVLPAGGETSLHELAFFHATEGAPCLRLEREAAEPFTGLIDRLEEEYVEPGFGRASVLRSYLNVLLVHIQRRWQAAESRVQDHASSVVRQFKKMLSEHFLVNRTVSSYADALGLTPGHLSETIKLVTRRTAGELIRDEVTTEAKRLLAHSDLTVAEVAYRLHFEDPSYFGRFFRRESGSSPAAFRKAFREKYQIYR